MILYYVRHGKTQGNLEKKYVGRTESPLIDEGVEGAISVGKKVHASGIRLDAIYASSLGRQRRTAELIAHEIGYNPERIILNEFLLERAGGDFEGKPQSDFFKATEEEQIAAGAESFKDLSERATKIIEVAKLDYPTGTVLFVGSAAIGEMMRAIIKYNDYTKMFNDGPLPNSELIRFI